jgi:hypothetical protein
VAHEDIGRRFTFVIRLVRDDTGRISGVLERVQTGQKIRVSALDGIVPAIAALLGRDHDADAST